MGKKFIVLFLMVAAVICMRKHPDFFQGCVRHPTDQVSPGVCTLVSDLAKNRSFEAYTEPILRLAVNQPRTGYLNTLLEMTRVAVQHSDDVSKGAIIRIEFMTARSACIRPGAYSAAICPPAVSKANGLCQARYFVYDNAILLQRAWCKPIA
ncbi:uncharacterized protein [Dermacentor albipictus]|uniref:uncharacterized protein n=1 Tax=Dermacentor albipictus TaxID=60249 RepID=UPI0038FD1347